MSLVNDTCRALLPVRDDRPVRILVSCIPSEGHFRPLLPLARALADRGHDVAFATAAAWEPRVEEAGYPLLAAGVSQQEARAQLTEAFAEIFALPPESRRPEAFTTIFALTHAPQKLSALLAAARSWRPDAIVYDSADLAAPVVAATLGVPSVNHSFGAMIPLAVLKRAEEGAAPLWRGQGLEPAPYAGAFGGLYVDISPPTFAWEQPLGESVRLRPVPLDAGETPPWLEELEPPLVYVTMGTVHNDPALFPPLLDALDGDVSAVVTVGRGSDPAAFGPMKPRVRIESFVHQGDVLSSCDAVICHGGSGTTLGALAHGVPLVLVPQGADQFDNAARCLAAGVAVVIGPDELSADSVRTALRQVLDDPAFAHAARRVAAEIGEMGTPDEVAAAVEAYVARGG
jgi:UDP:flavonoid glycosyltransferase YjiC (YdhE family)